jgi:hypothetical protein
MACSFFLVFVAFNSTQASAARGRVCALRPALGAISRAQNSSTSRGETGDVSLGILYTGKGLCGCAAPCAVPTPRARPVFTVANLLASTVVSHIGPKCARAVAVPHLPNAPTRTLCRTGLVVGSLTYVLYEAANIAFEVSAPRAVTSPTAGSRIVPPRTALGDVPSRRLHRLRCCRSMARSCLARGPDAR